MFDLNPPSLKDLQNTIYQWQLYNFGKPEPKVLVLGVCEEIGELCHATLKAHQKIRGNDEAHTAAIRDSVGDASIFAMNLCSVMEHEYKLPDKVSDYRTMDTIDHALKCYQSTAHMAFYASDNHPELAVGSVYTLNIALTRLCQSYDWSLMEVIRETWIEVGQRNWKKFPKNGMTE